jgi:hypothetical protein
MCPRPLLDTIHHPLPQVVTQHDGTTNTTRTCSPDTYAFSCDRPLHPCVPGPCLTQSPATNRFGRLVEMPGSCALLPGLKRVTALRNRSTLLSFTRSVEACAAPPGSAGACRFTHRQLHSQLPSHTANPRSITQSHRHLHSHNVNHAVNAQSAHHDCLTWKRQRLLHHATAPTYRRRPYTKIHRG